MNNKELLQQINNITKKQVIHYKDLLLHYRLMDDPTSNLKHFATFISLTMWEGVEQEKQKGRK